VQTGQGTAEVPGLVLMFIAWLWWPVWMFVQAWRAKRMTLPRALAFGLAVGLVADLFGSAIVTAVSMNQNARTASVPFVFLLAWFALPVGLVMGTRARRKL
jgi:hypothetical protein